MMRTGRDLKSNRARFPASSQCSRSLSLRWGRKVERWLFMPCGVMTYASSSCPELGLREVVKHSVHASPLLRRCAAT